MGIHWNIILSIILTAYPIQTRYLDHKPPPSKIDGDCVRWIKQPSMSVFGADKKWHFTKAGFICVLYRRQIHT